MEGTSTTLFICIRILPLNSLIYYLASTLLFRISIFNSIFPIFARLMTDHLEIHQTESQKQISLYIKIVLFQWTNTVLIWFIILPFSGYLESGKSGLLYRIQYQFLSEITIANVMSLLDLVSFKLPRRFMIIKLLFV